MFWWLGAWPIAGFNGVEITAALLLLRYNARAVRANEVIMLSASSLKVIRTTQDGTRTEQEVSPPGSTSICRTAPAACQPSSSPPTALSSRWGPA